MARARARGRRKQSRLRRTVRRLKPKKVRIGASTKKGVYGEAEW
ncbi:MAG: hypothetical protein ACE5JA_03140 [bacterium]